MASELERIAKVAQLKKEVVEILSACEGDCLDLSKFKQEYKYRFRTDFDRRYKRLTKGKKFKDFMASLDDVIHVQESEQHEFGFEMKLKEPHASHAMKNESTSPDRMGSCANTAASAEVSSTNFKDASSNVSGRKFLKAQRRVKRSNEVKEANIEPSEESTSTPVRPELHVPSSASTAIPMGACLLPLSPPPVPRLEASGNIN